MNEELCCFFKKCEIHQLTGSGPSSQARLQGRPSPPHHLTPHRAEPHPALDTALSQLYSPTKASSFSLPGFAHALSACPPVWLGRGEPTSGSLHSTPPMPTSITTTFTSTGAKLLAEPPPPTDQQLVLVLFTLNALCPAQSGCRAEAPRKSAPSRRGTPDITHPPVCHRCCPAGCSWPGISTLPAAGGVRVNQGRQRLPGQHQGLPSAPQGFAGCACSRGRWRISK